MWVALDFNNSHNWLSSVCEKFELHLIFTCLLELLSAEYLLEINISILNPNNGYLFFRFLERVFEGERNGNRKENKLKISVTISY